jgi:hypothetical protein
MLVPPPPKTFAIAPRGTLETFIWSKDDEISSWHLLLLKARRIA